MTGMGLLAVRNMRAMNANTVDITTNWMPSVRVLGDLRAGVITYRNVIREHMLAETLEEKLAAEKTLAGVVEGNNKIRAGLRADDHFAGRARALQRMVASSGRSTRRAPRKSWHCRARQPARCRTRRMN